MGYEATGNRQQGTGAEIATGPMAPRNDRIVDVPVHQQRSLATVTAEIRTIRAARDKMFLEASVEIGRRLKEAKELVGHGGWGEYCETELDFSQQTASNHIRLFDAYAAEQLRLEGDNLKSQAFGNLSYTQALALLALPSEEEREAFVETHDMENISTRELREEIARLRQEKALAEVKEAAAEEMASDARRYAEEKEAAAEEMASDARRYAAEKEAAEALAREADAARDEAEQELAEMAGRLPALQREKAAAEAAQKAAEAAQKAAEREKTKAEKDAKAAQKALEEARKNPQVPQEILDRLKQEAEAAAKTAAAEEMASNARRYTEEKEAAVQAIREEMESNARRSAEEKAALEKALRMAAPEMAEFKVLFTAVQEALGKAIDALWALPSDKVDGGVRAVRALLDQVAKRLEEERYEAAMPE